MKSTNTEKLYIGVDDVMMDFDVSKPKAYSIIHQLNQNLREYNPSAIIIAGKVNKHWYDQCCLKQ